MKLAVRLLVTTMVASGMMATVASGASADALTATPSAATVVRGLPMSITFGGQDGIYDSDGDSPTLYALVRPAQGGPCGATFGQDQQVAGSNATVLKGDNNDAISSGSFSDLETFTPATGGYIVCAWLETDGNDGSGRNDASSVVTASATASFIAVNTDSVAVSQIGTPRRGHPLSLRFTGHDTPYDSDGDSPTLYALVRPAQGGPCGATFGQDQQVAGSNATVLEGGDNNAISSGSFIDLETFTPATGGYIVCAWLETDGNDGSGRNDPSSVVTAHATASFTARRQAEPACVVPKYHNATLQTVKRRLTLAHCGIGRVRYVRSHSVRRGRVLRLSAVPGDRYRHGYRIGITVARQ